MITSGGIGSGLDIRGLVGQLVAAERAPIQARLDRREADAQAKLSAFGVLKGALSDLQTTLDKLKGISAFKARTAESAAPEVFTASAGNAASPGRYDVAVLQLARAHKLLSGGFAGADAEVGTGTLTLSVGTEAFGLVVDDSNKTLAGIRDAINGAADNPGVSATIINVDDGAGGTESKLVLSAAATGAANTIKVTVDDDDGDDTDAAGLSQLAYDPATAENLTELDSAEDAQIEIDGQAVTRASNTITDAIDGVTLSLLAESPAKDPGKGKGKGGGGAETAELTVSVDRSAASAAVQGFVDSFNSLVDTLGQLSSFDAATGTATTLFGDSTVRGIELRLRRELGEAVDAAGDFSTLSSIGVTMGLDGKLSVDGAALDAALGKDLDAVRELFGATENGVAVRLDGILETFAGAGGIIDNRTQGLNGRVDRIADQRLDLDRRMASVEQRLLAQFIAMDELVGRLQTTSDFLTRQLAALPKINTSIKR